MSDDRELGSADSGQEPQQMSRRDFGSLTLAAGALSAFATTAHAAQSSRNVQAVREMFERGFNNGDLTVADEFCAAKVVEHEYLADVGLSGPEALKVAIGGARKTVRNLQLTIDDVAEVGDKVWTRSTCRGLEGTTGKAIVILVFDVFRFKDGKLVEHWGVPDRFAMLHQVGLIPST